MPVADRPTIAIVTALKEELESILRRARAVKRRDGGLFEGRFGSANLVLTATGDGAANADHGASRLCDAIEPAALLGVGLAGALSPGLAVGDLVAGLSIRDSSGQAPPPDQRLLAWALSSGAKAGTLLTVEAPVVSVSEKAGLLASLGGGAADTFAAVDMESASWARAAGARGIPCLVVRSVSDRADEELPEYLARCVDENGQMKRAAIVGHGIARPGTIPTLLRMRRRMTQCGERLALFLERLLGEAP